MRVKYLILYSMIYAFIALIMGFIIINAESLGILGTNTMESSCHYSPNLYLNTIWEGMPCGFSLETFIILWIWVLIFPIAGMIITSKMEKSTWGARKINFIKWLLVFTIILFMTGFNFWQNGVLTIVVFYKLVLGTLVFLSPFLISSMMIRASY